MPSGPGLSARAITAIERGISRAPHKTTIELLCAALELSPEQCAEFLAAARRLTTLTQTLDDGRDPPPQAVDDVIALMALTTMRAMAEDCARTAPTRRAVGGFLGALPDRPIVTRED